MPITTTLKKVSPWALLAFLISAIAMAIILTINPSKEFSCHFEKERNKFTCAFYTQNYTHINELNSFPNVILSVSELISSVDINDEVYIAVDVAAYGGHSYPTQFENYKNSFVKLISDDKRANIILLPENVELEYVSSNLNDSATKAFMEESLLFRKELAKTNTREYVLPQLASMQFWVTKNSKGEFNSIIAWPVGTGSPAQVRGVQTQSKEVGQILLMVWQQWNNRESNRDTNDLINIISNHKTH